MDVYILDRNYQTLELIDGYESLIWTDRFFTYGDFEIYTPISSKFLSNAIPGYYLWNNESDRCMIIEDISIVTEVESGNHVSIVGRSLESILDRRIVWNKKSFTNADPVDIVFSILNSEIENPVDSKRQISNFKHEPVPDNLPLRDLVTIELWGETVLEVLTTLLEPCGIGFSVILNELNELVFSLKIGTDRSYKQELNPWVIFSAQYENLVDTSYSEQHSTYKNVALIKGDEDFDTGVIAKASYAFEDVTDLDRKEIFVDATDIGREDENGNPISEGRYQELLIQRGKETLNGLRLIKTFEGGVETHTSFTFNQDYYLGDIVQIVTPTGVESSARITEVIRSFNDSGLDTVPTFSIED